MSLKVDAPGDGRAGTGYTETASLSTESLRSSFVSISPPPSVTTVATNATAETQPPPYHTVVSEPPPSWTSQDPRSASTQSLGRAGEPNRQDERRTLLLVYVHGFMGSETSFQSFPAHVHNLLSVLLANSHTIHTKIYPRYRSRHSLQVAANNLSNWLEPHETPNTDIVLIGHSLGGLVAAEVALIPSTNPMSPNAFRHQLLGTLSFDTPFLGMHPGVIKSGLSSIFKPAESPQPSPGELTPTISASSSNLSRPDTFAQPNPNDPNFNPTWRNDVVLPTRKGWSNALHFVHKHSNNLLSASKKLVHSHLEFGGCLADYEGLKARHTKIRMLEEDDEMKRRSVIQSGKRVPRVRFVNYYTASTGRPKRPSQPQLSDSSPNASIRPNLMSRDASLSHSGTPSLSPGTPSLNSETPSIHTDSIDSDIASISSISSLSSLSDSTERSGSRNHENSIDSSVSVPSNGSAQPIPTPSGSGVLAEPPASPYPPPDPKLFAGNRAAYAIEVRKYLQHMSQYCRASKEYQRALSKRRKEEMKSLTHQRRARKDEDRKIEQDIRQLEAKRIAEAETLEDKRKVTEEAHQRRRADHDIRHLDHEKQAQQEHERRRALREEDKVNRAQAKRKMGDEKAALKNAMKGSKAAWKSAIYDESFGRKPHCAQRQTSNSTARSSNYRGDDPMTHDWAPHGSLSQTPSSSMQQRGSLTPSTSAAQKNPAATKKDKKFCTLPTKDSAGRRDPTWRRVYMDGVDEVGAHTGLFFPQGINATSEKERADRLARPPNDAEAQPWSERYARLVGDVAEQIEGWVQDLLTERVVSGVQGVGIEMEDNEGAAPVGR
ncbi:MAG: hypothetical protein M1831_000158 [Alyxoria varia]|nr:MAG: hypothetical protein M1831_000158 [Alyxoria varia]